MAELTARFTMVDELSGKLAAAAEQGHGMADSFKAAESAANGAFDDIEAKMDEMMAICDSAAGSLSSSMERATSAQSALALAIEESSEASRSFGDSLPADVAKAFEDASGNAAMAMDQLSAAQADATAAMDHYDEVMISGTEDLGELEEAAERAKSAALNLAAANGRAGDAAAELAEATAAAASASRACSSAAEEMSADIGGAASSVGHWTSAVGGYDRSALEAVYSTKELVEMGYKSADALKELDEMMALCERGAKSLSLSTEHTSEIQDRLEESIRDSAKAAEKFGDGLPDEQAKAYASAVQEATDAMAQLRAAQEEAAAAMEHNEEVISSGTDDLGTLEEAAGRAIVASENLAEANGRATDAAEGLDKATADAAGSIKKTEESGSKAAGTIAKAITGTGLLLAVRSLASSFMEASMAAAQFEQATAKISTIADTSRASMESISSGLMDLSRETGESVVGLSEAAYSAISASVDTADAVEFTGTATKLAAGGFTESSLAVDVLTTALNAYGLSASEAESISDMLITTQNLGKTTVNELASSIGGVIPLASAYGVEMDNLSAAYAELTKNGISTAESTTYIKSMLTELGDSGSDVAEILASQTGKSFADLMEEGYSLGDVLEVLGDAVGGNAVAFSNLWSGTESSMGALSLYNAGAVQFNSTLEEMQNSVGATQDAYEAMTNTTAHAQEEMANAANNMKIAIGSSISPMTESIMKFITNMMNGISDLSETYPIATKIIAAAMIGVTAFGVAIAAVTAARKLLTTATVEGTAASAANTAATVAEGAASGAAVAPVMALGTAIKAATGPVGLLVAGVTAATVAIAAFAAMNKKDLGEVEGMTATTREQYYAVQDLNEEYELAASAYGKNSKGALRLKYQLDELNESFDKNRQTVEEFSAEVEDLCSSAGDLASEYEKNTASIDNEETSTLALSQRLQDLASQSELTGAQQKELEAITNGLAEKYPELGISIDKVRGNTEKYAQALKKACEQEADQKRLEQSQDTYIEALAKREELTNEIAKAEENVKAQLEYMDKADKTHFWNHDELDELEEYQDALDKLRDSQEENEGVIEDIEEQWGELAKKEEEAAEKPISYKEAAARAYQSVQEELEELATAYDDAYNAAKESMEGQFELFDNASMESDEYLAATVENATSTLSSQQAYWETYLSNIQMLKDTSAKDLGTTQENYDALVAYIQDGSEEAAGLAGDIASAIESGNSDAVKKLAEVAGDVSSTRDEVSKEVADWQTGFEDEMNRLVDKMDETVDDLDMEKKAKANAKKTIEGYAKQISDSGGNAVAAAQSIAERVAAALSFSPISAGAAQAGASGGAKKGNSDSSTGPAKPAKKSAKPGHASGTTYGEDVYIAGEEGPELIVGKRGSTVFPAEETSRIISEIDERSRPLNISRDSAASQPGPAPNAQPPARTEEKRITLDINGSGEIGIGGGTSPEAILSILQENIKPVLMRIIQSEIYEEGEMAYEY